MINNRVLGLKKVYFSPPFLEKPIINNVSFSVNRNDFMILLGSNGSGKSSLINMINRNRPVTKGSISLLSQPLNQYGIANLAKTVVTLTQNSADSLFMEMTVAENAMLSQLRSHHFFDHQTKNERLFNLQHYLKEFHPKLVNHIDTPVSKLSGGEKQILILALALQHSPSLILLDEHTSALDPKTSDIIMEKTYQEIAKRNITCIMTTHNLDFALRYGNRLLALKNGEIVHQVSEKEKPQLTKEDLLNDCY